LTFAKNLGKWIMTMAHSTYIGQGARRQAARLHS
jgi:hypothetical protein